MTFLFRAIALSAILCVTHVNCGESVSCNDKQFRCNSGDQCIPINWQCDSDPDCDDKSDEKNCVYKSCSDKEFRCNNQKCISKSDLCDGFKDCADGEDESGCKAKTCNATTEFTCKRGLVRCIPLKKVCDDVDDCSDLSDESIFNCHNRPAKLNPTCREDEFKCINGGCVSKQFVCDGKKDCLDGSDERNQTCGTKTRVCGSDEFKCSSDKKCISLVKRCDNFKDCADGSDEHNCNRLLKYNTKCPGDNDFFCGIPGKCVTQGWRCDGEPDCPNGADERDCTTTTCLSPKLACNRGNKCIHPHQMCDGKKDCDDGLDEICPYKTKPKECDPKTHFQCTSAQLCIKWSKVCDNITHCPGGEDEKPGGKKANCRLNPCSKSSCTQLCQNRYTHAQCSCRKGFKLREDGATCVDIDECKIWGMCSQGCENYKGGHKCSCEIGYELKEQNGKRYCRANGHPTTILLASQEYIRQYQIGEVGEERPLVSDLINVAGLDYDLNATSPVVFWSQPTPPALMMAKINLTGKPERIPLYSKENSVPEGLAYDWVHKLLYMTDPGLKRIAVISLKNPKMKAAVIATGNIDEPRAIVVDPLEGWLYWTDWGRKAKISKIGMNGLYRSELVNENIILPNALALDRPRRRLYWSDAKLHSIFTIDLNGGDRRLIFQDPDIYPYSMSVFEDNVYWSDWHKESVLSVNKFSGENLKTVFPSHRISAIRVMHPLMQPSLRNHCPKHHPCSHYCLPSPRVGALLGDTAFSCSCPEDLVLMDDDRTCTSKKNAGSQSRATNNPSVFGPGDHHGAPTSPAPLLKQGKRVGHVAGIVIGVVLVLTLICGALMYVAHRVYSRKNTRSMNFDNPVYRKTPVDGEGDTEAQYPINPNGSLSLNSHSSRAPIWNGGVVNGAVEA